MTARTRGDLFIVSSPSGGGKTTLIRRLIADPPGPPLHFSVSHTTRRKRAGERNGREYHFVTDEAFRKMVARRAFLEHNARWEAAAGGLYVHRHTLRYRMRKVEELTGRDLSSARDRMEFFLALRARDLLASGDRSSANPARPPRAGRRPTASRP